MKSVKSHSRALFWLMLTLAAVTLTGGCRDTEEPEVAAEIPRNVRIVEMSPGPLTEYFEISGPVGPVRGADLSAEEAGSVVRLAATKGQTVTAGEIIMEQDRGILLAEKISAEANLETESYNVDKVRQLNEAGKVSRIDLLNAESQYERAKAMATISRDRYRRAAIRAPFDGTIVERFVEVGQLVMPGQPVVRVIDPSSLKLEAYLTDQEVPWIKAGVAAQVRLGDSQDFLAATVTWIALEADRMTGKFKMELEIPNPDGRLRSGVIGRARIPKDTQHGVLSIPRVAVMHSRRGTTVFVVEGDRARQRNILLGTDQGSLVTVEHGLAAGEKVVVRGHRALRDSSLVTIQEISTRIDGMLPGDPEIFMETNLPVGGSK